MSALSASAGASVAERLSAFRRRRTAMAITVAMVAAIYMPFVAAMPNLYRASAKVLVEGQADSSVAPAASGEVDSRLQEIKQIAFSRLQLTRLAEQYHLYTNSRVVESVEARADRLLHDIKIDIIGSDAAGGRPTAVAFQVSYVGSDPATVAAVANTIASFYVAQNDRLKARVAGHTSALLAQQVEDSRRRLAQQDDRLRAYTAANMGALPQQSAANIAALERLNTQVRLNGEAQMRLVERRQTLQNQIAELETKQQPVTDTNDPSARLALLEKQLADLKTRWTDSAPDVKDLQQQITALKQQVAASAARRDAATAAVVSPRSTLAAALAETTSQLQRLAKENERLSGEIADVEARVDSAPVRGQQYETLARDEQVSRDMYESLLKRSNEASLTEKAEAGSTEEFRILDPAISPRLPAGPNRRLLLMLGAALCLIAAVGVALLLEHFDTSFHSLDELRAFTRIPVLASIPEITTPQDRFTMGLRGMAYLGVSAATVIALGLAAFRFGRGAEPLVRILLRLG